MAPWRSRVTPWSPWEPQDELRRRFTSQNIIDGTKTLIMPGLINSHTHAAMTCFRGIADDMNLMDWLNHYIFPAEARNVDPELAYWGSLLACAEMIKSGTTSFCDMYIFEEETARAAQEAGMRCLLGEVLFDFPSPNYQTPQEGLAYTRGLLERWAGDPLIRIAVEPHALYTCSRPLLVEARKLADEFEAAPRPASPRKCRGKAPSPGTARTRGRALSPGTRLPQRALYCLSWRLSG